MKLEPIIFAAVFACLFFLLKAAESCVGLWQKLKRPEPSKLCEEKHTAIAKDIANNKSDIKDLETIQRNDVDALYNHIRKERKEIQDTNEKRFDKLDDGNQKIQNLIIDLRGEVGELKGKAEEKS